MQGKNRFIATLLIFSLVMTSSPWASVETSAAQGATENTVGILEEDSDCGAHDHEVTTDVSGAVLLEADSGILSEDSTAADTVFGNEAATEAVSADASEKSASADTSGKEGLSNSNSQGQPGQEKASGTEKGTNRLDVPVSYADSYSVSAYASASDYLDIGKCGTNLTYVLSANGVLSITGEGDMTNYADASSVPWYQYRSLITTVKFTGGITSIGDYAFEYCVGLDQITIPDSVQSIGMRSFYKCTSLKEITIPGNVTGIGAYVFVGCTGLTSVVIPDGVESIGAFAFFDCTNLADITLPESVTSIGEGAFDGTKIDDTEIAYKRGTCGEDLKWSLLGGRLLFIYGTGDMTDFTSGSSPWYSSRSAIEEVVVSDGVTGIGNYALKDCQAVERVTLSGSVVTIGSYAFSQCTGLSGMDFSGVTEISDYAFYQSGLAEVILSGSHEVSMGKYAFADCKSLKSVDLGNAALDVGDYVFSGCTGLKDVAVSTAFHSIGSYLFANCVSLSAVSLTGGCSDIGAYMFSGCKSLTAVDIPAGTTEIGQYAFQNCTGIPSITLPDSVVTVDAGAFAGCSSLTGIQFSKNIETIGDNAFKGCVGFSSFVVPDSVSSMGSGVFSGCYNLEKITLPFVGGGRDLEEASAKTLFGYIFGNTSYSGSKEVKQYYSSTGYASCYLPEKLVQVTVTGGRLLYGAFDNCALLESITIPGGITGIGSYAFRGCTGLTDITLPVTVTELGDYVFRGCTGLGSIKLPQGLLHIGSGAFSECTGLESMVLPEQLTEIGSYLFSGCTKLQEVTLPGQLGTIGDYAWKGCEAIKDMELPNTVSAIGKGAFQDCTGLQEIKLPDGITAIEDYTFQGCTSLQGAIMPDAVERVGSYAFKDCESLAEALLPRALTELGSYAFEGCSGLETINIPLETTAIQNGAFKDCTSLQMAEIPGSVASIGSGVFSGCSSLAEITLPFVGGSADAETAGSSTLFGYIFGTASYTGGTAVKQYYSASGAVTYYIPDTLESVTVTGGKLLYGTFYGCSGLENISIHTSNEWTEIGNCAFYNCTGLKEFSMPEVVSTIGSKAFSGCTALEKVVFPDVVESLGEYAFSDCTSLVNISLPKSLQTIGSYAFSGCTSLESISLSGNLQTIGTYAFKNCSSVTGITVPDSVTAINSGAFSGCSSLESITLPFVGESAGASVASAKTLFGYVFGTSSYTGSTATKQNYSSAGTTYYIPDSLSKVVVTGGNILYGAFCNCSNLKEITLPDGLTGVGNYAFYNCAGLSKLTIPAKVETIGTYAFGNCSGLQGLTLPAAVAAIGTYAFQNCSGLREFVIPEKVTTVENYLFSGCSGLRSVSIPQNVTSIGSYSFQNCSSLASVTVPDTVTVINTGAFSGCSGLESMTLPFVGSKAGASTAAAATLFGVIFGTASYTGGILTKQYYSASSAGYYIPASLRKVVITGGNILYGSFYNCSNLTSITMPNNLTEIGKFAFCNCTGLADITIPSSVTTMGINCFQGCTGLKEFTIPNKVDTIGNYTFSGCSSLETIIIPDSVATVGSYAFQNCSSLTGIIIPDSVTSIGSAAFSGCSSLISMTLPFVGSSATLKTASTQSLFGYIFGTAIYTGGVATKQYYSKSGSTQYYIPASLKAVEITGGNILYGAFYGCSGLTSITLPNELTGIGSYAFYSCSGLAGVIFPLGITSISASAFAACSSLQYVTFSGNAPTTIDATAFSSVTATVYYPVSDGTWTSLVGNQYGGTLSWVAHTHSYKTVTTAPTCTEPGFTTYQCTFCSSYYVSDYVNALGHTLAVDEAVHATCTEPGLTEGIHCSVCSEVILPQETVQATGHDFTNYVSNKDATYDSDGTKTAECGYGCGETDTIVDEGSKLTDNNNPEVEISMGTNQWASFLNKITFGLCFKNTQTVTITAADHEKLPDGSLVDRLDQVYYYVADTAVAMETLDQVSWEEYRTALSLNPSEKYIVYAKAIDKSANVTYVSSDGIIVDDMAPVFIGILNNATYCKKAVFSVSDLAIKSVVDNGTELTPDDGKYTIEGDDKEHRITAVDQCGNTASVSIVVNSNHTWGEYTYNNDAACMTAGTKTAVCEFGCGVTDTQIDESHPALGHDYGQPVFEWSDDDKSCTAHYTCSRDSSHAKDVSCIVRAESPDATCTTAGTVTYTATATLNGVVKTDSKTVSGVVLGHDYKAAFTWSEDGKSCTADLTCQREGCTTDTEGHSLRGLECKVETNTIEATCVSEGKKQTVAGIIVDGIEYTEVGSTQTIPINPDNHVNTQIYNAVAATCLSEGYTGDTYCNDCKKTVKTGTVIAQLEHEWGVGVYTKEATCKEAGTIVYTCINGCNTSWEGTVPINPDNHKNIVITGAKDAKETEDGYTGDTYCNDCGKTLAYGSVIPALGGASPLPGSSDGPGNGTSTTQPPNASGTPSGGGSSTPVPDTSAAPSGDNTSEPAPDASTAPPDTSATPPGDSILEPGPGTSGMPETPPASDTDGSGNNAAAGDTVLGTGVPSDDPLNTEDRITIPAKGTKLKNSTGMTYKVTKAGKTGGTVSFVSGKNKNITSVAVPAKVTIDGITYQVTAIAKSAFSGCKKLKKVTIGKNIKTIGNKAFYQCTKLTTVTVPAQVEKIGKQAFYGNKKLKKITIKTTKLTAKNVGSKAFGGIHSKAVVTVPAAKQAAYQKILKKKGISKKKQKITAAA